MPSTAAAAAAERASAASNSLQHAALRHAASAGAIGTSSGGQGLPTAARGQGATGTATGADIATPAGPPLGAAGWQQSFFNSIRAEGAIISAPGGAAVTQEDSYASAGVAGDPSGSSIASMSSGRGVLSSARGDGIQGGAMPLKPALKRSSLTSSTNSSRRGSVADGEAGAAGWARWQADSQGGSQHASPRPELSNQALSAREGGQGEARALGVSRSFGNRQQAEMTLQKSVSFVGVPPPTPDPPSNQGAKAETAAEPTLAHTVPEQGEIFAAPNQKEEEACVPGRGHRFIREARAWNLQQTTEEQENFGSRGPSSWGEQEVPAGDSRQQQQQQQLSAASIRNWPRASSGAEAGAWHRSGYNTGRREPEATAAAPPSVGPAIASSAAAAGLVPGLSGAGSAGPSSSNDELVALRSRVAALESELAAARQMAAAVDRLKVQLSAAHPDAAAAVDAAVQKEQAQQEVGS